MERFQDNFLCEYDLEAIHGDFLERDRCNSFQASFEMPFPPNLQEDPLCSHISDLQDISLVEPNLFPSEVASTTISEYTSDDQSDAQKAIPIYQFVVIPCNSNKIGSISYEERQKKLQKYREKKARRTWRKKVNYDSRKKVADKRLRYKGRFITRDQAISIGIQDVPKLDMEKQEFSKNMTDTHN
ncbi:unnamed protein product [Blepharisma stoltei]|uniref:CCT domain-containing protein n=1 Tax=Blepharisma stoltei TaxID=1481888 RepID=A0AAU9IX48_9CILI|nr:unnamed protein product [Blepharisma stoltei]